MWSINYENHAKFHISIGIGLLLLAGLMTWSTIFLMYDKTMELNTQLNQNYFNALNSNLTDKQRQEINDYNYNVINQQIDTLGIILANVYRASTVLFIGGFSFYFLGYIPFMWWQIKPKSKQKKVKAI